MHRKQIKSYNLSVTNGIIIIKSFIFYLYIQSAITDRYGLVTHSGPKFKKIWPKHLKKSNGVFWTYRFNAGTMDILQCKRYIVYTAVIALLQIFHFL